MTAYVLGVDPGHGAGAAVLLAPDGRSVEGVWAWAYLDRKVPVYDVREHRPEMAAPTRYEAASLHRLASAAIAPVARDVPHHLVVEGLFVWEGHDCGFDTLAEATGEIMGPLRDDALSLERPLARSWRPVVLPRGWGRTSAEAERAAHTVCRATMAGLEPWLGVDDDGQPLWPHVCEAALMARWGWVQARGAAQQALVQPVAKRAGRSR